jgi:hypothetical protein
MAEDGDDPTQPLGKIELLDRFTTANVLTQSWINL